MLQVVEIPVTPFQQNCTLLICTETRQAAVCDCGDAGPVLAAIAEHQVEVKLILATHVHAVRQFIRKLEGARAERAPAEP